ncbi:putative coat protein [Epichloe festucae virus 1]|uniref:Putative coat protein n=1 Tax=Epichloe festucae virus 1 TaxID=382962 RepID=Q1M2S1_9VIRU|nr:putative coat protein [Epichloe festucae virus 1]CAK02787.1 putative coat protein [Epichloe festucae virus 1]
MMSTAQTQNFQVRHLAPLTGAVADPVGGLLQRGKDFRRYRSGLSSEIPGPGRTFVEYRSIFYEVGRHYGNISDALATPTPAAVRIDCSHTINETQAANFEGLARQYSNFASQWEKMDLCGIAERLARAIATQSVFGGVTTTHMRAGQPLRVVALGTLDSPQTASTSSVFIPRTVDSVGSDHVFAVLCAAANGEGASVSTDVLRLDVSNNAPLVPAVAGAPLATACVEALRVLGANMEESGAGDLFAYAVTRGIHRVVTVVSHTDEGGILRDLLRHDAFRVPYGGINASLRHYPALPSAAGSHESSIAAWVDGIALKTAAVAAHCDPLVPGVGGMYPTVLVASKGSISPPGTPEGDVSPDDARSLGRQLSADIGRFAPNYIRGLSALFGLQGYTAIAERHLCATAGHYLEENSATNRHLLHKTIAPYFWVEPTSLIPRDFLGTSAESENYAAKVSPGCVAHEPLFEKFAPLAQGTTMTCATAGFKMRTARTSGYVCSQAAAPASLAMIQLKQFDTQSVVLAGDQGPISGDVVTKHRASSPLSSYLWVRGQSALPAPAEFINTQGCYGAKIKLVDWTDDWDPESTDVPRPDQFATGVVAWRVSLPTGLPTGPSNAADRQARRARSRGAIALAQALNRARAFGEGASPTMEVSDVPPDLGLADLGHYDHTGFREHRSDPGKAQETGDGNPSPTPTLLRGAAMPPTEQHKPQGGPRLPAPPPTMGRAAGPVGPPSTPAPPPPAPVIAPPTVSDPPPMPEAATGAEPVPQA